MTRANWSIVKDDVQQLQPLVIRDDGDGRSVTNDAEAVVAELVRAGKLPDGRRLFYYDSMGALDEILIEDGKFVGFAPGPR